MDHNDLSSFADLGCARTFVARRADDDLRSTGALAHWATTAVL